MARSVSTPHNAVVVAYRHYDDLDEFEWDNIVYDFRYQSQERWPSLIEIDKWLGREDHAFIENEHAIFGISEYCGLVAYWVVPHEDEYFPQHNSLHEHWCLQIADNFNKLFGDLVKLGTFSNGEAIYRKMEPAER
jgi:hypothetical protein